jgi:hypothetical protein
MLGAMNSSHIARTAAIAAVALALSPAAAQAAGKTETLRFFSTDMVYTFTEADGTVHEGLPETEPQAGDVIDIYAVDYAGNHRRHSKRPVATDHTRCTFGTAEEPECVTHAAIGSSLLIVEGFPGTIVGGTGRYYGATGRVIKNKEVKGGSDVVVRVNLRGKARSSARAATPVSAPAPAVAEPAWERALRVRGEAMNAAMNEAYR